ncbi:MAG: hypothetical protein KatS3mg010_1430 [Acidimicrobiia bacterium]|nr:MAG: hypothetical protein KatS3mg010_1430 [Acidimicrobiia bacterium]
MARNLGKADLMFWCADCEVGWAAVAGERCFCCGGSGWPDPRTGLRRGPNLRPASPLAFAREQGIAGAGAPS